jgi:membrane protease YdiL (CAAX protease family)
MPKLLMLLIIITAWIISFLYPFFRNFLDEQELDLTYIGLLGLLIFILFLIKNQSLLKNCPIKFTLLFTPFVAMKFDIINFGCYFYLFKLYQLHNLYKRKEKK